MKETSNAAEVLGARRDSSAFLGRGDPDPLTGDGRDPALLALHGFGGSPQEVELVTRVAQRFRLRYSAPLLPGHGTNLDDLARSTWQDWHSAATSQLDDLGRRSPVLLAGLSMGAVLALELAAQRPNDVKALVVLSNALTLTSPFPHLALAAYARLGLPSFNMPKSAPDIVDPIERRRHLTYKAQPVRAALELWRAGGRVRGLLDRIQCPVLVMHGRRDRVCPSRNAHLVADNVSSEDVRLVLLSRSHHIITRDVERPIVYGELCDFLQRFVPNHAVERVG